VEGRGGAYFEVEKYRVQIMGDNTDVDLLSWKIRHIKGN